MRLIDSIDSRLVGAGTSGCRCVSRLHSIYAYKTYIFDKNDAPLFCQPRDFVVDVINVSFLSH